MANIRCDESEDTIGGESYQRGFISGYTSGNPVNILRFKNVEESGFGYHATVNSCRLIVTAWRTDTAASAQCQIRVGLNPAWKFINLKTYPSSGGQFTCWWARDNITWTSSYVTWNIPSFAEGTAYATPYFTALMQTLFNGAWFKGGDIFVGLFMTGTGVRTIVEGDPYPVGYPADERAILELNVTEDTTYKDPGLLKFNGRSKISVNWPQETSFAADARSKLEFAIQQASDMNVDAGARSKLEFSLSTEIEKQLAVNTLSKVEIILESDSEREILADARSKLEIILGKVILPEDLQLKARSLLEMVVGRELQTGYFANAISKVSLDLFNWSEWLAANKWRAIQRFHLHLINEAGIITADIPAKNFELYYSSRGNSHLNVTVPWGCFEQVRMNSYWAAVATSFLVDGEESLRVPICSAEINRVDIDEMTAVHLQSHFQFPTEGRDSALYPVSSPVRYNVSETGERVGIPDADPFMRPGDRAFIPGGIGTKTISAIVYRFGPGYFDADIESWN